MERVGNEEEKELWEGVPVKNMSLEVSFDMTVLEKKTNHLISRQPSSRPPNITDLVEKLDSNIYTLYMRLRYRVLGTPLVCTASYT